MSNYATSQHQRRMSFDLATVEDELQEQLDKAKRDLRDANLAASLLQRDNTDLRNKRDTLKSLIQEFMQTHRDETSESCEHNPCETCKAAMVLLGMSQEV